jgi:hypothetical protein
VCDTASGTAAMAEALEGLEVNEKAMRANLESLLKGHEHESVGAAGAMVERALADWITSRGTAP